MENRTLNVALKLEIVLVSLLADTLSKMAVRGKVDRQPSPEIEIHREKSRAASGEAATDCEKSRAVSGLACSYACSRF